MNVLIGYASKHGCTERCAELLAQKLEGKVDLYDLKSGKSINLSDYEKVIIGSSVYVGKVQKEAAEFCNKHKEELQTKKIGFFICGTQEGESLELEMRTAYPEELQAAAVIKDCFGGAYVFSKMNLMERTAVKIIAKTNKDTSTVKEAKIASFAEVMNKA